MPKGLALRLPTPVCGKLFPRDHATPVWHRNIKIPPGHRSLHRPRFRMAGLGNGIRHPLPRSNPSESHAAEGDWMRLAPGDPGRILVDLPPATRWERGLNDAACRHVAGFKGVGPAAGPWERAPWPLHVPSSP